MLLTTFLVAMAARLPVIVAESVIIIVIWMRTYNRQQRIYRLQTTTSLTQCFLRDGMSARFSLSACRQQDDACFQVHYILCESLTVPITRTLDTDLRRSLLLAMNIAQTITITGPPVCSAG